MSDQVVVISLFVIVFALLITEKLDKTVVALAAASFLVLGGFLSFKEAVHAVDFDTICLLLGMMISVECLRAVDIFSWLAIKLGLVTGGNPVKIFFLFAISTALLSAFLDNVTTVLVMVPLVISLCRSIGVPAKAYVLALIFLSNIGGTWTLIGDPPNILIGSQVPELTFTSFMKYLTVPVWISAGAILFFLRSHYREVVSDPRSDFKKLFLCNLVLEQLREKQKALRVSSATLRKSVTVFGLILLGFFTHHFTHLEPAAVALAGAALSMLVFRRKVDVHHLVSHIEWTTLLFFAGLFVLVGALEEVGALNLLSNGLVSLTDDTLILILIVLVASAVVSGVVDNIPFVAVMIPVLKNLLAREPFASDPKGYLVWWALSLGACFGGNSTIIGASANVVSCAIARSNNIEISFKQFLRDSLPVTIISILISALYLTALYLFL